MSRDEVGIAELRQNLSKHLQRVKRGERLVVTERNRPVATLAPVREASGPLERLIAAGGARPRSEPGALPEPLDVDLGDPRGMSTSLDEVRREALS
ncbi:MAG: type II toxin-antitoxin system Phd/YefM family antitoxin [Thermoleophilaceae bacterium]